MVVEQGKEGREGGNESKVKRKGKESNYLKMLKRKAQGVGTDLGGGGGGLCWEW